MIFEAKGLIDKAIEQYQEGIKVKPDLVDAYFNLAVIHLNRMEKNKARNELEIVLQINPGDTEAQHLLNSISH